MEYTDITNKLKLSVPPIRQQFFGYSVRVFLQTHNVDNVGIIANFVLPYIYSFIVYLHQLLLVGVKLDIKDTGRYCFHSQQGVGWGGLRSLPTGPFQGRYQSAFTGPAQILVLTPTGGEVSSPVAGPAKGVPRYLLSQDRGYPWPR